MFTSVESFESHTTAILASRMPQSQISSSTAFVTASSSCTWLILAYESWTRTEAGVMVPRRQTRLILISQLKGTRQTRWTDL